MECKVKKFRELAFCPPPPPPQYFANYAVMLNGLIFGDLLIFNQISLPAVFDFKKERFSLSLTIYNGSTHLRLAYAYVLPKTSLPYALLINRRQELLLRNSSFVFLSYFTISLSVISSEIIKLRVLQLF